MTTTAEQHSAYLLRQILQRKSTADLQELARIYALDLAETAVPAIYQATLRDLVEVIDELRYRAEH